MANALSRVALQPLNSLTILCAISRGLDLLSFLPTEIRLMIFEQLLIVRPKTFSRGAIAFGPLEKRELDNMVPIPWQILSTCWNYHDEAAPIMYGKNKLVFCTGPSGDAGCFYQLPLNTRYLQFVTDVGIYFQADNPSKIAAQWVALFIEAFIKYESKIDNLVVLASSDRYYEAKCPWDILWCDHPVSKQLVRLIESKIVKHLKLRFHDGAGLYQVFGRYLEQLFYTTGSTQGRSIAFTKSCTCPPSCRHDSDATVCAICHWPLNFIDQKPIEAAVHPFFIEADEERLMNLQGDLFDLGLLPQ